MKELIINIWPIKLIKLEVVRARNARNARNVMKTLEKKLVALNDLNEIRNEIWREAQLLCWQLEFKINWENHGKRVDRK